MKCPICEQNMDNAMDKKFAYWTCVNCGWTLKISSFASMEFYNKHGRPIDDEISFYKSPEKDYKIDYDAIGKNWTAHCIAIKKMLDAACKSLKLAEYKSRKCEIDIDELKSRRCWIEYVALHSYITLYEAEELYPKTNMSKEHAAECLNNGLSYKLLREP